MFRYIVSALSQLHRGVLICGGFALFMVFGALLLMLPFSTTGNAEVSFVHVCKRCQRYGNVHV